MCVSGRVLRGLQRLLRRLLVSSGSADVSGLKPPRPGQQTPLSAAAALPEPRQPGVTGLVAVMCDASLHSALLTPVCLCSQMLFQFPASESQPPSFFVGGPMVIDNLADSCQQAPPPAPLTPAPPPSTPACIAGPSFAPQGSETSFDCSHCGKSLRSRKNYSKHMFIHSGTPA